MDFKSHDTRLRLRGEIRFSHTPFIDIHGNPSIPIEKVIKLRQLILLCFLRMVIVCGKWKFGNINGFGQYTWEGIGSYKGNWLDGKKHGNEQ